MVLGLANSFMSRLVRRTLSTAASLPRALVVCPGRGSYGSASLGTLSRLPHRDTWQATIQQADAQCRATGISTISELDGLAEFDRKQHLEAAQASALTLSLSVADYAAKAAEQRWHPIGFVGNSLGWHTATHLSGALPFEAALDVVLTTGVQQQQQQQQQGTAGGLVVYPAVDEFWDSE